MKIFFDQISKFILINLLLLPPCFSQPAEIDGEAAPSGKLRTEDVVIEWLPQETQLPTHRLSAPKIEDKADRVDDELIFQGPWRGDTPHGQGTCYKGSEKKSCHFFQGILVIYEGDERRNELMRQCMPITSKTMAEKYSDLKNGSPLYRQKFQEYLLQCYKYSNEFLTSASTLNSNGHNDSR